MGRGAAPMARHRTNACRCAWFIRRAANLTGHAAGKIGYVSIDAIAPFGNDQICYVKDTGARKIGGYIGGGEPQ